MTIPIAPTVRVSGVWLFFDCLDGSNQLVNLIVHFNWRGQVVRVQREICQKSG